jgi:hypothetical protein
VPGSPFRPAPTGDDEKASSAGALAEGMMTADGWIRNGAVSEVECKVRHNTVHLSIDMGSNLPIFISGATYGQDCRTT